MEPWALCVALVVLAISSLLIDLVLKRRRAAQFPRSPPAWPIIGHLPLLAAGLPHQTLANLARQQGYGPIVGLRLGSRPAVVVSSATLAKEVLMTQDKAFASRPHYQFMDLLLYGYETAVAFSSYGSRWAKLRKVYTLELFTAKRLQDVQHVRQAGVRDLLRHLQDASRGGTQAVSLTDFLGDLSSNTMSRLMQSKTLSEAGGEFLPSLIKELEHEVAPTLGDFIPWLKPFDLLRRRNMKHIHDRVDNIIDSILSERRLQALMEKSSSQPRDFLQVLLSKEATDHEKSFQQGQSGIKEEVITSEEIKGSMLDIFAGGTHTTAVTLEWAMAELLRNPRCLCKLRDEIDAVMGKGEELVHDEDVPKLPYLQSTVKEVFRLHPTLPLLLPRISSTAAKVDKYMLPTNTHVLVNVWAIGRDPDVWEDAESFVPERFDGKETDVKGFHFDLLPFGSGRRICPGMRLALSVVHVTLANLIKTFDWELPDGQTHTDVDMSEKRGMTCFLATHVRAIPKLRLRS